MSTWIEVREQQHQSVLRHVHSSMHRRGHVLVVGQVTAVAVLAVDADGLVDDFQVQIVLHGRLEHAKT